MSDGMNSAAHRRRLAALVVLLGLLLLAVAASALALVNRAGGGSLPDTTAPPPPAFTRTPPDPSGSDVRFHWDDAENGFTSRCTLDGASVRCTSRQAHFRNLADGAHRFCVRAIDRAGNVSSPTCYSWRVVAALARFTISGDAGRLLFPGGDGAPLDLAFDNPNGVGLQVTSLSVSISSISAPHATAQLRCSARDFAVTQFSGSLPFTIPAGGSTLSSLGVASSRWPSVRMLETGRNQDGCQGATVHLFYSGKAHS